MKFFEIVVNGQNIEMRIDSETRLLGFYTTCYIEATSEQEAARVSLLRVRARLDAPAPSPSEEQLWKVEELNLTVDEISPILAGEMDEDTGFAWYEEK